MKKTDLILQWEMTKLLVDKEMHEAGKQQDENRYAIQSELSIAISLFIGDIKKLDLHSVSGSANDKLVNPNNCPHRASGFCTA